MIYKFSISLLFYFGLFLSSAFAEDKLFYVAPSQFTDTDQYKSRAGFWISRHPAPDQLVMDQEHISAFNLKIQNELKLTKDIFSAVDQFKTESLVGDFERILKDYEEKGYYTKEGVRFDKAFLDKARKNMNLSGMVLGMTPRYGLVSHYADVRFLPTAEPLYETAGDIDFDQLQNSTLDVGTPVAVVHQSLDKKWYYVLSNLSDGWIQADRVALGEIKKVKEYVQASDFIVVTSPQADIFIDEPMMIYHDFARMGTRFPLTTLSNQKAEVLLPRVDKEGKLYFSSGFLAISDVHAGYLPYTPRIIFNQAFLMLDDLYGWGGMYGRKDCSAFLDEIFSTVGIILPRDSKDQAQVGGAPFDDKTPLDQKTAALKLSLPGATILPMKGHIMLYLGTFNEKPYAIHAVWAYREHKGEKDVPRVLNRVTVSSLSLGEGSQKGSLLKRLSKVVEIK
jgi:hypothetical protein